MGSNPVATKASYVEVVRKPPLSGVNHVPIGKRRS